MTTQLIKIEQIVKGTIQLFKSMDKGFTKLETDANILCVFHKICFDSIQELEGVLLIIERDKNRFSKAKDDLIINNNIINKLMNEMLQVSSTFDVSTEAITVFIDKYSHVWNHSYTISALQKFKSLLINEFSLLEKEIENLQMELLRIERTEILTLHQSPVNTNEDAGSVSRN